ncbi:MAG: hypothetical protein HKM93_07525 [Desulfobacteraceae bacterium]|nr:hypothetical protein [Desulfobacteraceae bacterium]
MVDNGKEAVRDKENSFKLHYFPEIPASFTNRSQPEPEKEPCFKKSDCVLGVSSGDGEAHQHREQTTEEIIRKQIDEAYEAGYQKGLLEGKASENGRIDPCVQSVQKLIHEFDAVKAEIEEQAETMAVHLALDVVRKILQTEPKTDPQIIRSIVGSALRRVMDHTNIVIRINPTDLETLERYQEELRQSINAKQDLRFETDRSIAAGGCYIETDFGDIDAKIDSQFKVISDALTQETAQGRPGSE